VTWAASRETADNPAALAAPRFLTTDNSKLQIPQMKR
jgi:hypothetical protein